jgi:hypothetical protein
VATAVAHMYPFELRKTVRPRKGISLWLLPTTIESA